MSRVGAQSGVDGRHSSEQPAASNANQADQLGAADGRAGDTGDGRGAASGAGQWLVVAAAVVVLLGSAWPVLRNADGFPLSNFPMFARDRPATASVDRVVGLDAAGGEITLSPIDVGGTYEVIQAAETVTRAIRAGEAVELCGEIAQRVSSESDDERSVVEIEVVTETHDVVGWFDGQKDPLERTVHARCTT